MLPVFRTLTVVKLIAGSYELLSQMMEEIIIDMETNLITCLDSPAYQVSYQISSGHPMPKLHFKGPASYTSFCDRPLSRVKISEAVFFSRV